MILGDLRLDEDHHENIVNHAWDMTEKKVFFFRESRSDNLGKQTKSFECGKKRGSD